MQVEIPQQFPVETDMYGNGCVRLSNRMQKGLGWRKGEKLEIYCIENAIFVKKKEE